MASLLASRDIIILPTESTRRKHASLKNIREADQEIGSSYGKCAIFIWYWMGSVGIRVRCVYMPGFTVSWCFIIIIIIIITIVIIIIIIIIIIITIIKLTNF